jgi:hypothetical protein
MAKAPDAKPKPNTPAAVALLGEDQPTSLVQVALQPSLKAAATIQPYTCDLGRRSRCPALYPGVPFLQRRA